MELRWLSSDYGRVKTLQWRETKLVEATHKEWDIKVGGIVTQVSTKWIDVPTTDGKPAEKSLEEKLRDYMVRRNVSFTEFGLSANMPATNFAGELAKIAEQHFHPAE